MGERLCAMGDSAARLHPGQLVARAEPASARVGGVMFPLMTHERLGGLDRG
jgi:hypothetical protein